MSYIYDGDGSRVEKCTAGLSAGTCSANPTGTLYWHDTAGKVIDESDLAGSISEEYYHFLGQVAARVDRPSGTVHYYVPDHLGSARIIATPNSSTTVTVAESDYYPYGGEIPISGSDPNHYKFTGKERDAESGLDNFGARYYTSSMGRFMSPDWAARPTAVPYAVFGDPQSLNLYNYVRNDPISRIDPDGHYEVNASGCGGNNAAKCQKKYGKATQRFEQARQKDLKSKDPNVRAAAEAYGNSGEKNGVHVGFADLKSQGIKGEVDHTNSGKGKLIDVEVTVDIGLKGKSLQETVAHEGSHVGDDIDFLTSYNFGTGRYEPAANFTHGQTEFDAFQTGAGVTKEHGFGPHDDQKILDFLHNSPTYGPIFNVPVFNPNDPNYPQ